ncbi:MAG: prepilin-type N-terminal cleavage/methylation domain-containing protein [Proteobacteria bacterium]|nr:prepilin-type N-terminal cleavage/methylation domain-containing protein [Pseudomonadota bacterium]
MHNRKGLTIIELVVVMCILGIMVLIAIPNIGRWLPRYRLRSAARDVASNMQLARLGAIKDNREWALLFDVGSQSYRIISDKGPDGNWGTPDDVGYKGDGSPWPRSTKSFADYTNVGFGDGGHGPVPDGTAVGDGVTFVGKRAEFNPGGTAAAGTIYLQNNRNGAMAIRVDSSTGIIRIWTWDLALKDWKRM